MKGWVSNLVETVRTLLGKERVERELDEELAFHIEQETLKHLHEGLEPEEARRRAMVTFGGVERTKERVREERSARRWEDLLLDLRFGLRTLRKNPGYSAVVLLTLGLGIGANTAIFSVVSGVLLDPLPYADGDELVYLRQSNDATEMRFSVKDIEDLRSGTRTLEEVVEYHGMSFTLLGQGEPEEVSTGVVSHNFFRALGTEPVLGRDFTDADDDLGAAPVLLLSHGYWQQRFGADPSVVGRAYEMNGLMHTVIGVLPPVPQFPDENDVYMPTSQCPIRSSEHMIATRDMRMMAVFGRMRDGTTVAQAGTDVDAAFSRLQEAYPDAYPAERGQRVATTPLKEELVQNARPTLLVLLATAGFVLLIACANVANLALARITRREPELSVRTAMGAGRGRIARQLLTESTLLALGGGALGLAVAWGGLDLLVEFAGRFTPRAREAAIDGPVLAFTLLASVVTGLGFGALPAAQARRDVSSTLRAGGGQSGMRARGRVQNALVVLQLAVTVMLLVGAGLLVRSFLALQSVDPGYDPRNVLTMAVPANSRNSAHMTSEQRRQFFLDVVDRLEAHPAVVAAAVGNSVPMRGSGFTPTAIQTLESSGVEVARLPRAEVRTASPGFFDAIGARLLAGRVFDETDRQDAPRVVMINETLARQLWPDLELASMVGRPLRGCGLASGTCGEEETTVAGIFADVRQYGLHEDAPAQVYGSSIQADFPGIFLLVRTQSDPRPLAPDFVRIVHELAPTLPVENIQTLEDIRSESLAPRRLTMVLLGLFAGVALAVSLAGIGGMLAFSVSQRTREIGIRMALGAERPGVLRMVLGRGLRLVVLGLGAGVLGALALGRLMGGLIYEIETTDPVTFVTVVLAVLVVAALACWLPARRATRIDPVIAFRGG